jgi:hypothetical protein
MSHGENVIHLPLFRLKLSVWHVVDRGWRSDARTARWKQQVSAIAMRRAPARGDREIRLLVATASSSRVIIVMPSLGWRIEEPT